MIECLACNWDAVFMNLLVKLLVSALDQSSFLLWELPHHVDQESYQLTE